MADLSSRSLAPEGPRNFSFSTITQPESREKHKNYVFVDEHNRHRRLKVMRACAACRRRKIKCDAATTNTWPCAPCVKQQLECVPPSSDKDGQDGSPEEEKQSGYHAYQSSIPGTSPPNASNYQQQISVPASYGYASSVPSATSEYFHTSLSTSDLQSQTLGHDSLTPITPQDFSQQGFQPTSLQKSPTQVSVSAVTHKSDTPDGELANVLQDLKIDQGGVAPYIANQQTALADGPPVEEQEVVLPAQIYPNSAARIPSEMWPPEQQAKQYFDYFFDNVHPYVPVVNRMSFYQLWQVDRYAIPPLVLEGIFACSAHMLGHAEERNRWLALAIRHEESFRDVPRLGTIQGLILIMKARESTPRRGYYYRSWMTIQYMISMAKDLRLHQHNKLHAEGKPCGTEVFDCALKTRIWHTLFQMETMNGGPQGRYDFAVDLDTVDLDVPKALPGIDFSELKISQDQTYFVRLIHNIRRTISSYVRVKANGGDCATDKAFIEHNEDYLRFGEELPAHLRVKYPEDGSAPSIPFHFVANLQCYQLLGIIMHHRPQLENKTENFDDGSWKNIMITCYSAATKICRLNEAIVQNFGLNGLICMVRGINTAIYTVLSCTMLHLVALTSPDPELNSGARDYFTRHMRILEQCSSSWPVPQMQIQIDSLRQAFSANLSKPFELKPNFPFGSPKSDAEGPAHPADTAYFGHDTGEQQALNRNTWANGYEGQPMTPPQTTASIRSHQDLIPTTSFSGPETSYAHGPSIGWDPSVVMDKWHSAFNPSTMESPSPGMQGSSLHHSTVAPTSAPMYGATQQASYFCGQAAMSTSQPGMSPTYPPQMAAQNPNYLAQTHATAPSTYVASMQPYVTPSMWQDAVAQSYGSKRRWDGEPADQSYKRIR